MIGGRDGGIETSGVKGAVRIRGNIEGDRVGGESKGDGVFNCGGDVEILGGGGGGDGTIETKNTHESEQN